MSEGYVIDYRTGREVEPHIVGLSYSLDNLCWVLEDIWNLEHNDMEPNPEFVEAVLTHIS